MKIGVQLFYMCVINTFISVSAMIPPIEQAPLALAKERWMIYADTAVEIKRAKFMKKFGMSTNVLGNKELLALAQYNLDKYVDQEITSRQNSISKKDEIKKCAEIKNMAYTIAHELQIKSKIKVINDPILDAFNIGIVSNTKQKTCWLLLNALEHIHNKEELADVLRHEFCHVLYQDKLYTDLLKSFALADFPDRQEEINKQFFLVLRACETRADIYAVIHSPDYGKHSLTFLRKMEKEKDDSWPTHPHAKDRITVIESVKKDLETVASKR